MKSSLRKQQATVMSSFELKPSHHPSAGSTADSVLLQPGREELPVLLAQRVTLEDWQQTFDGVHSLYAKHLQDINNAMPFMMIPCFICCTIPRLASMQKQLQDDWADVLRREQQRYRKAGIQLSLYREVSASGFGSSRRISNEVVGLKFDVPVYQTTMTAQHHAATAPAAGSGEDYAQQLNVLHQLHKTGGLTDSEFENAKAKILAKM